MASDLPAEALRGQGATAAPRKCPDLRSQFHDVVWRAMPHSYGELVGSDWADKPSDDSIFGLYKNCGFLCRDEVRLVYDCAVQVGGRWLEIGAHTGWCTLHLLHAGCEVIALEPMFRIAEFARRFWRNLGSDAAPNLQASMLRSDELFEGGLSGESSKLIQDGFDGVLIDGDHNPPRPVEDTRGAARYLHHPGIIVLHDVIGGPVQEALLFLISDGFCCKVYPTVHGLAVCWRGSFLPPVYAPMPHVKHRVLPLLEPVSRYL